MTYSHSAPNNTVCQLGYGGGFGYQEDEGSGLRLLGHRYYDSSTGRFLTKDPIKDGRNWYVYCENDPISNVDPLGLYSLIIAYRPSRYSGYIWVGLMDDDGNTVWISHRPHGIGEDAPTDPDRGFKKPIRPEDVSQVIIKITKEQYERLMQIRQRLLANPGSWNRFANCADFALGFIQEIVPETTREDVLNDRPRKGSWGYGRPGPKPTMGTDLWPERLMDWVWKLPRMAPGVRR